MRDWMKAKRKERGMLQRDVAEGLGITLSYYNYIENGKRKVNIDLLMCQELARVFHMPVEEVIREEMKL